MMANQLEGKKKRSNTLPEKTRYRSIPIAKEVDGKARVVIIGGGIAGLTVAHELVMESKKTNSECDVEILVLEKHSVPGGKARTLWTDKKHFSEHSMRVLPGSYVCMHQIMKEIPHGEGHVIDRLTPVTIQLNHGDRTKTIHGNYRGTFMGSVKYLRDVVTLLWFLKRSRVRFLDMFVFVCKIFRLLFIPSRRVTEELSRLKFSEYVGGEDSRTGRFDVIYRMAEILVAAKSYSSAGVVSRTLLEWFVTPFLQGKHVQYAVSEFDTSTSEALIDPWVTFLKNNGVLFKNALVEEVDAENGQVGEVRCICLDTNEYLDIKGDIVVMAVQHNLADVLIGDRLRKYLPQLSDFPKLGEEWAHSVQVQIPVLSGKLAELGATSVATLDSPWSIAYRVYSAETWSGEWKGPENGGVFTATISNTKRAGKVYELPFLRCTPEQIYQEIVAQTGLEDVLDISASSLGLDLRTEDAADASRFENQGFAITAIGPDSDQIYVTDAQMYIRLPGNLDIEPENATGVYNFFLAGEYTRTKYRIPTMEKSCESGKRCAQEIISGLGCGVPREIPRCRLPFSFIRSEFFHLCVRLTPWVLVAGLFVWILFRRFGG